MEVACGNSNSPTRHTMMMMMLMMEATDVVGDVNVDVGRWSASVDAFQLGRRHRQQVGKPLSQLMTCQLVQIDRVIH